MKVDVVFLQDFCHGSLNAAQGKTQQLEKSVAEDLERAGLLRISMAPVARVVASEGKVDAGKAPDGGEGQPSSALPAAQVSLPKTLTSSGVGAARTRKAGAQ